MTYMIGPGLAFALMVMQSSSALSGDFMQLQMP
jgi:hypothetical protein